MKYDTNMNHSSFIFPAGKRDGNLCNIWFIRFLCFDKSSLMLGCKKSNAYTTSSIENLLTAYAKAVR